jgi:hypothetical protein
MLGFKFKNDAQNILFMLEFQFLDLVLKRSFFFTVRVFSALNLLIALFVLLGEGVSEDFLRLLNLGLQLSVLCPEVINKGVQVTYTLIQTFEAQLFILLLVHCEIDLFLEVSDLIIKLFSLVSLFLNLPLKFFNLSLQHVLFSLVFLLLPFNVLFEPVLQMLHLLFNTLKLVLVPLYLLEHVFFDTGGLWGLCLCKDELLLQLLDQELLVEGQAVADDLRKSLVREDTRLIVV